MARHRLGAPCSFARYPVSYSIIIGSIAEVEFDSYSKLNLFRFGFERFAMLGSMWKMEGSML